MTEIVHFHIHEEGVDIQPPVGENRIVVDSAAKAIIPLLGKNLKGKNFVVSGSWLEVCVPEVAKYLLRKGAEVEIDLTLCRSAHPSDVGNNNKNLENRSNIIAEKMGEFSDNNNLVINV